MNNDRFATPERCPAGSDEVLRDDESGNAFVPIYIALISVRGIARVIDD